MPYKTLLVATSSQQRIAFHKRDNLRESDIIKCQEVRNIWHEVILLPTCEVVNLGYGLPFNQGMQEIGVSQFVPKSPHQHQCVICRSRQGVKLFDFL